MRFTRPLLRALILLVLASAASAAPMRFASPFLSYGGAFGDRRAVAIADANQDALPDVLTIGPAGLEVRLGSGDGSLAEPLVSPASSGVFLAVGDLDGDGDPDVVTNADSLNVKVMLGQGDGTFAASTTYSTAKGPVDAVLADLDEDGNVDLLCVGSQFNMLSVRLGDGAGGFGSRTDYPTGTQPRSVTTGDVDHDGDLDVAVSNFQSQNVTRLLGDGNGALVSPLTIPLSTYPWKLVLADLDGDTWLDLVVNLVYDAQFLILPGLPGGGFSAPLSKPLRDVSTTIATAHLDDDAMLDVIVVDYYGNNGVALLGTGGFAFEPPKPFDSARGPNLLAVGDLNGGGKLDAVSVSIFGSICVHMGNGNGTFGGVSNVAQAQWPVGVACADLDADGLVDLATTSSGLNLVLVSFGVGGGSFTSPVELTAGLGPQGITIADVDDDGHQDLVVAHNGPGQQAASSVGVFLGDGARGFASRQDIVVGRWAQNVAVGDLNGDPWPDLAVACNDFGSSLTLVFGQGGGAFAGRQDFYLGGNASDVAVTDVTRDGLPDVLLATYGSNQAFVLPRSAGGGFGTALPFDVPGAISVAAGDITGDSAPDLVVAGSAGVSVFPSIPLASFDNREDHPGLAGQLVLADFDDNGRIDVATANGWNTNSVSLWFGQPAGGLALGERLGAGDRPNDLAVADVNQDGLPDLVSANIESHDASLLINTGGVAWLPWLESPPPRASLALALRARPNPFHGRGWFDFSLPRTADVRLRVLDVAGREMARFEIRGQVAGDHSLRWDARGVSPGVYFAELQVENDRVTRRVILLP